jgi:hypothetical protein
MIRLPLSIAFAAFALAACGAPAPDEQEQTLAQSEQRAAEAAQPASAAAPTVNVDATRCDALQAQWTAGKPVGDAEAEQARKDAGATSVRVLKPGQPVTMDFNGARLNIEVDEKGIGVSVRCG